VVLGSQGVHKIKPSPPSKPESAKGTEIPWPEPEKPNEYVGPANPTSVPLPFVIVTESAAENATQTNIIAVKVAILFMGDLQRNTTGEAVSS